ncbi:hypothetical protein [Parendozoicomonas haliclonae]|uniref:DUF2846 domain-containing protein n=1 Tax=Parendozoicomonas haliclonae TaxID=1960125 RepID=A0A1X7AHW9_9GAMM|nr:hypothetical protein [Parendozoicomonas haliclonae]SMA41868.1 hypothetical protein EHSB41UT_01346 [Parendozoicomonas haliclonae]
MNKHLSLAGLLSCFALMTGCASTPTQNEDEAGVSSYTNPVVSSAKAAGRGIYWTFDEGAKLIIKGLTSTRDAIPENVRETGSESVSTTVDLAKDGALYGLSLLPNDVQKLLPEEIEQAIPGETPPETTALPTIPAEADALIFVMRPHFTGVLNRFEIYLNGKEPENLAGFTQHYEYVALPVMAGRYTIHSKAENWSSVAVRINAGERIFLEQKASKGLFLSNQTLVQITPQKASEYMVFTEPGSLVIAGQEIPGQSYMDELSHLADYATRSSGKRLDKMSDQVAGLYQSVATTVTGSDNEQSPPAE